MHKMTPEGPIPLTAEEIAEWEAHKATAQAEQMKTAYVFARQNAYPAIADQLDILFHGGFDAWKTQIQAIKDAHPKPE